MAARRFLKRVFSPKERELARLARMPRRTPTTTNIMGFPMSVMDSASFLSQYKDIHRDGMYAVRFETDTPRILDCGANIGMSVLYWKSIASRAMVTAFEADPEIVRILASNLSAAGCADNVEIIHAAVCTRSGTVRFVSDGADAGHLGRGGMLVPAVRLRDHLTGEIDLLKLDIEGEEVDVLLDSADLLHHVGRVVLEYHSLPDTRGLLGEVLQALTAAGFRLVIKTEHAPPHPFLASTTQGDLENRLNIYGLRE